MIGVTLGLLLAPKPGLAAGKAGTIRKSCVGGEVAGPHASVIVLNMSGYDPRTWGNLKLDLPPDVRVCDYKLHAGWGDREVEFMHREFDAAESQYDQIVLVGYSMGATLIGEALELWDAPLVDPAIVDKLDLVIVAPAAAVKPGLDFWITRRAERWSHAWRVHFEGGLMRREYMSEWAALFDRTYLVLATDDQVVDASAIDSSVYHRLGARVITVKKAGHVDLRSAPEVSNTVSGLLGP